MFKLSSTLAIAAWIISAAAQAAPRYTVQNLSALVPDQQSVRWYSMNNAGELLGSAGALGAVRYIDGAVQRLGYDYGSYGHINNRGDVTFTVVSQEIYTSFYIPRNGAAQTIPVLDPTVRGNFFLPQGINDSGTVVGISKAACPVNVTCYDAFRAATYEGGALHSIEPLGGLSSQGYAINNAGDVVGWTDVPQPEPDPSDPSPAYLGSQAFHYSDGEMKLITSDYGTRTQAVGINDAGQILGENNPGAPYSSWIYEDGAMITLRMPGAWETSGVDINNAGQVIGLANRVTPWIYSDGELRYLSPLLMGNEYQLERVYDINDLGQILATGINSNGATVSLLLSPVPEPGTSAMLLGGLAAMAFWRRRQNGVAQA